jgi:hypothetical protein
MILMEVSSVLNDEMDSYLEMIRMTRGKTWNGIWMEM